MKTPDAANIRYAIEDLDKATNALRELQKHLRGDNQSLALNALKLIGDAIDVLENGY